MAQPRRKKPRRRQELVGLASQAYDAVQQASQAPPAFQPGYMGVAPETTQLPSLRQPPSRANDPGMIYINNVPVSFPGPPPTYSTHVYDGQEYGYRYSPTGGSAGGGGWVWGNRPNPYEMDSRGYQGLDGRWYRIDSTEGEPFPTYVGQNGRHQRGVAPESFQATDNIPEVRLPFDRFEGGDVSRLADAVRAFSYGSGEAIDGGVAIPYSGNPGE